MATNLSALDAAEPYDYCVVGSGPAGTILGTRLVEAGFRTVILESGGSLADSLFNPKRSGSPSTSSPATPTTR